MSFARRPALPNPRLRPPAPRGPGWWIVTPLVRGGPPMPARVFWNSEEPGEPGNILDQPFLDASIGLERVPPERVWDRREHPITEQEWKYQIALLTWLHRHAPDDPRVTPRARVDLNKLEPLI